MTRSQYPIYFLLQSVCNQESLISSMIKIDVWWQSSFYHLFPLQIKEKNSKILYSCECNFIIRIQQISCFFSINQRLKIINFILFLRIHFLISQKYFIQFISLQCCLEGFNTSVNPCFLEIIAAKDLGFSLQQEIKWEKISYLWCAICTYFGPHKIWLFCWTAVLALWALPMNDNYLPSKTYANENPLSILFWKLLNFFLLASVNIRKTQNSNMLWIE